MGSIRFKSPAIFVSDPSRPCEEGSENNGRNEANGSGGVAQRHLCADAGTCPLFFYYRRHFVVVAVVNRFIGD